MSLTCNVSVAVNKDYNTKRHDNTKHTNFCKFTGQTEKDKFSQLKNISKQQSSVFQRQTAESENKTLARCKVAQLIAKDKRPSTDGKFGKKSMMAFFETVCPKKVKLFLDVVF